MYCNACAAPSHTREDVLALSAAAKAPIACGFLTWCSASGNAKLAF
jgi:hypothetical protein